jgi:hypothetical protein
VVPAGEGMRPLDGPINVVSGMSALDGLRECGDPHPDAGVTQLRVCRFDVGDDDLHPLGRSRRCRPDAVADDDRAVRPRGVICTNRNSSLTR